jgi:hypothetical protein
MLIHCISLVDILLETSANLLGREYMAAIPARKSRAKPLPPVAEAAYGPYDAIM